jgi:hypothetical protein
LAESATFTAGLVAAPFLVTGVFRLLPGFVGWLPFVLLLGASAALVLARPSRWLGAGLAAGTLVWAVLLALLLADMGRATGSVR